MIDQKVPLRFIKSFFNTMSDQLDKNFVFFHKSQFECMPSELFNFLYRRIGARGGPINNK